MAVQMIISIWKRDDMTYEEFSKYWTEIHAPKFLDLCPATRKYISRYEQYHIKHTSKEDAEKLLKDNESVSDETADGVAFIWADSISDMEKVLQSREFLEYVGPDNANFLKTVKTCVVCESGKQVMWDRDADAKGEVGQEKGMN